MSDSQHKPGIGAWQAEEAAVLMVDDKAGNLLALEAMLADLDPPSPPALTDESIALWQELLPLFRAQREG